MIDHIDSRLWADHGHQFSDQLASALSKAWLAFKALNRIQFDAPWKRDHRTRRGTPQA